MDHHNDELSHRLQGKQFIAEKKLTFSSPRLEERFVSQFITVSNGAPKCEPAEAVLEHVGLYLLWNRVTGDYSIDVEEACRAWPRYSETMVSWLGDHESPRSPGLSSPSSRSSSSSSLSLMHESDVVEAIATSTRSADASKSLPLTEPFNMFQAMTKPCGMSPKSVSSMYVMWKVTCGAHASTMRPKELHQSMYDFLGEHLGYTLFDRSNAQPPTKINRGFFQQYIVKNHGLEFTSESAKEELLWDWCHFFRSSPQSESVDAVIDVFISYLEPKGAQNPRFGTEKTTWPKWIDVPQPERRLFMMLGKPHPVECTRSTNTFNWFQQGLKQRGHFLSKRTMVALYAVFGLRIVDTDQDEHVMQQEFEKFVDEKFPPSE